MATATRTRKAAKTEQTAVERYKQVWTQLGELKADQRTIQQRVDDLEPLVGHLSEDDLAAAKLAGRSDEKFELYADLIEGRRQLAITSRAVEHLEADLEAARGEVSREVSAELLADHLQLGHKIADALRTLVEACRMEEINHKTVSRAGGRSLLPRLAWAGWQHTAAKLRSFERLLAQAEQDNR